MAATGFTSDWSTTQYRCVSRSSVSSCSALASVSRSKPSRMAVNPTGASLLTASVPRKSRSPSARTVPPATGISSDVATARSVTPAHATSASSSMSPEQASEPSPPVAGCRPATASALPVATEQLMPCSSSRPCAVRVTSARSGFSR